MNPVSGNKRGYLLPMVIIYMIIAMIVGLGILTLGSLDRIEANKRLNLEQAFYLAEAGINLAYYRLKENAVGLPYEICFNEHYVGRPLWSTLEILVHEMIHLYQENTRGLQPCKNGYHNLQFCEIAEDIGLYPILGAGAHWRPAAGQFARLMQRFGVDRPIEADRDFPKPDGQGKPPDWRDEGKGKPKGKSTLIL